MTIRRSPTRLRFQSLEERTSWQHFIASRLSGRFQSGGINMGTITDNLRTRLLQRRDQRRHVEFGIVQIENHQGRFLVDASQQRLRVLALPRRKASSSRLANDAASVEQIVAEH